MLKPEIFIENSFERKNFNLIEVMKEAKLVFGNNEGNYFLTEVENINHRINQNILKNNSVSKLNPNDDPVITACECVKDSECTRMTGISFDGLSWEYGKCSTGSCYRKSFLWWESDKNRICTY